MGNVAARRACAGDEAGIHSCHREAMLEMCQAGSKGLSPEKVDIWAGKLVDECYSNVLRQAETFVVVHRRKLLPFHPRHRHFNFHEEQECVSTGSMMSDEEYERVFHTTPDLRRFGSQPPQAATGPKKHPLAQYQKRPKMGSAHSTDAEPRHSTASAGSASLSTSSPSSSAKPPPTPTRSTENVVAFGVLERSAGAVETLHVRPSRIKEGVGTKILEAVEHAARQAGTKSIRVITAPQRVPFFAAHGYELEEELHINASPDPFHLEGSSSEPPKHPALAASMSDEQDHGAGIGTLTGPALGGAQDTVSPESVDTSEHEKASAAVDESVSSLKHGPIGAGPASDSKQGTGSPSSPPSQPRPAAKRTLAKSISAPNGAIAPDDHIPF